MTRMVKAMLLNPCDAASRRNAKSALGIRHLQMVLIFFGLLLVYAMRVNMSMAIVVMTDPKIQNSFSWSTQVQSVILSSFFWGYIMLQIPGGELASRIGGKVLLVTSVGINSALVLFIPWCAAYGGWKMVCACRVLQGLAQGVIYPSIHCLLGKWVPVEEKSRLGTLAYIGSSFGTALQLTTAGFIADSFGWPMIFYSVGVLGAIWTVFYTYWGSSSPRHSKIITKEEREYIESSLGVIDREENLKTPWTSILTSGPFLALIVVHCGNNWGFWTLMTEIPSYMKKVLGVDIKSNGVLSALPYMALCLLSFPCGIISDYTLKRNWLSMTTSRKISNSIGFYGAAIALVALCHAPPDVTIVTTLLTIAISIGVGHMTGFLLVHIDMAPNFAGSMMGITNAIANIIAIISPLVAGAILQDNTDPNDWKVVFYLSAAVYVVTNTVFIIFGTSERQEWNDPAGKSDEHCPLIDENSEKT